MLKREAAVNAHPTPSPLTKCILIIHCHILLFAILTSTANHVMLTAHTTYLLESRGDKK
jgi:hypothetical protein